MASADQRNDLAAGEPRRFRAFISYRHADNAEDGRRWAYWLHKELERYQVPRDMIGKSNAYGDPIPENLYPIFRDEEEMRAGEDLGALIADGLDRSEWLIVLCSPRSAASRYVRREIIQFKLLGKADRILPVIVDGDPGAAERNRSGNSADAALECFPRPLRRGVPVAGKKGRHGRTYIDWRQRPELLAADLRPSGTRDQGYTSAAAYRSAIEARNPLQPKSQQLTTKQLREAERRYAMQLELQRLKIVAGLLGVDLGELTKRDAVARARRLKRLLTTSVAILVAIAVLAVAAVYQGLAARSNLAASRYTLANVESEEHAEPAKAFLLATAAVQAAPAVDALIDVYARRAEMLALASPRSARVADQVRGAVFSPRLDRVAVIDDGGRVRIADLHSTELLRVPSLTESHGTVASFTIPAFSADGSRFVAGIDENSARSWRLSDGRSRLVETPRVIVRGTVQSEFYFSPDGRTVLGWTGVETGDEDGQHVEASWSVESGMPTSVSALKSRFEFGELAWSRDPARNWAVNLVDDGRLEIVDVTTGEAISPQFGPAAHDVKSLALSANGEWLVTVSSSEKDSDFRLQLWSAREGKAADVEPMHSSTLLQIQDVSHDGKKVLVVAGERDNSAPLQLWEFGRGSYRPFESLGTVAAPTSFWAGVWGKARLAAFCGDTPIIAAVSAEPAAWTGRGPKVQSHFTIRLWHAQTAQELSRTIQSTGGLIAWSVSPDGREIGTVTADGVVTITDLFWHQPAAPSSADSAFAARTDLNANRAWFSADRSSITTARTEGIIYVGGMPISEGQPRLIVQRWRVPDLDPLWNKPVEMTGEAHKLASAIVASSADGSLIAIGISDIVILDARSGTQLNKPLAVQGALRGVAFSRDGERFAFASDAADQEGKAVTLVEQRHVAAGRAAIGATIKVSRYREGNTQTSDFAGFTADARHFMRVFAGDRFTGDWSSVRQLDLLGDDQATALSLRFSRESPAPPALVAAVLQDAVEIRRVSSSEILVTLAAAHIRVRAVPTGATLDHVEAKRPLIAASGRYDATVLPVLSADARWICTVGTGHRELRVWSTLTGMPSSETIILHDESVTAAFDGTAHHVWHLGRSGGPQAIYVGANARGRAQWLVGAGEALTGMRLTGQGVDATLLSASERRAAREEVLQLLSSDTAKSDSGARQVRDRLAIMLAKR